MAIVGGLDIHRRQITYDWIDFDTGQARHGRIQPATRVQLRAWLARLAGQQADFAFEGTTGWRFVAEEVMDAGFRAHLAEPADTRALRGPKRRAKTGSACAGGVSMVRASCWLASDRGGSPPPLDPPPLDAEAWLDIARTSSKAGSSPAASWTAW
jgi:hypothetical protein